MIQVLLILHVLVSVALMGAVTHQAFSVARKPKLGPQGFISRFQSVNSMTFTNAIVVLYVANSVLGGLVYPRYRVDVRPILEDLQLRGANGLFEIKEHFAAVALGVLPAFWLVWRTPLNPELQAARKYLTWMIAFTVWWNFIVGELLNNIKGLYP
jgi:hypothetical protein